MLKKILLALLVIIVALVVVILLQPSQFHVERSASMAAAPTEVFDQVNNLHKWMAWSPWEKRDPDMKRTFEGPEEGKGAVYGWSGNDDVGAGKMTIIESKPGELVRLNLEFIKPFESSAIVTFTFTPEGKATKVNWAMDGDNDFMGKAFSLFMNMDAMIGKDFNEGLANLKKVVEAGPADKPAGDKPKETPKEDESKENKAKEAKAKE